MERCGVAFWFELAVYRLWGERGWFGLNYFRMFWTSGKQRAWGKGRFMSGTKKKKQELVGNSYSVLISVGILGGQGCEEQTEGRGNALSLV